MKKNHIIILLSAVAVILAVVGVVGFIGSNKSNVIDPPNTTGNVTSQPVNNGASDSNNEEPQMALDFTLTDLNGQQVTLSELKGKNVFLNFFTTWCGPCKREMPEIQKIQEEYKDKDLLVYLINLNEDEQTVKDFMEKNNYNFNVLMDPYSDAGNLYRTTEIPTSLFINKEGKIVKRHAGQMTYDMVKGFVEMLYK